MHIIKTLLSPLRNREAERLARFKSSAERRAIELFTIQQYEAENYVTFKGVRVSKSTDEDICERLHEFRANYVAQCLKEGELI